MIAWHGKTRLDPYRRELHDVPFFSVADLEARLGDAAVSYRPFLFLALVLLMGFLFLALQHVCSAQEAAASVSNTLNGKPVSCKWGVPLDFYCSGFQPLPARCRH